MSKSTHTEATGSQQELFDFVLHLFDLGVEVGVRVAQDGAGDNIAADTTGTAQISLLGNVHIGNILIKWRV